jgi:methylenetetrahydrofolate reductase (NADPH)
MPTTELANANELASDRQIVATIAQLAQQASVEITVPDAKHLSASREFLAPGTRVFVSHLPGQEWAATIKTCVAARQAGFVPIAHIPVRLLESLQALRILLRQLQGEAGTRDVLLISGDYSQAIGPFGAVVEVLATGLLEEQGLQAVSVAGHPEGHPRVDLERIRAAEREKIQVATQHGLKTTMVTQFLFEPAPFLQWIKQHRAEGLRTRFVCGLAGPAKISTLLRYAMRCGVGPSIRALGTHHGSLKNLLGDHGPDRMLRHLAKARVSGACEIDAVHLFCFGGFLRTAKWLSRVQTETIRLGSTGGFEYDLLRPAKIS